MDIEINVTGGTYKTKSQSLSAQVTRNFWPQKQQNGATKSPYVLESWVGLRLAGTATGNGADRGMLEHRGILYRVAGTTLYGVSSDGTHTAYGTIPGTGRCIMWGIGTAILIVTGGRIFQWDSLLLTEGNDVDFESPNSVTVLNTQAIYDGIADRFCVSDPGDPLVINSLNYATAESNSDNLLRVYAFDQNLYLMGEKTIEPWWNSGSGNPPFDRLEGAIINVGLGALHSAANNDKYLYFYGDDNHVYALQGANVEAVSDEALQRIFGKYTTVSDAIGWCMSLQGQQFYVIKFPTEDKTWVYPEGGSWFEWSSGIDGGACIANSYAYSYRKHFVADESNGNLYELDFETYTENNETIVRLRDSAPLHGGMFGKPGKDIEFNRFQLILEVGTGLSSGQGSDPVIMLSLSNDGGKSFGTEMWGNIGKLGENQKVVEWGPLGSAKSWVIRLRTSDPVHYSIHSAAADIAIGI